MTRNSMREPQNHPKPIEHPSLSKFLPDLKQLPNLKTLVMCFQKALGRLTMMNNFLKESTRDSSLEKVCHLDPNY